MSGAENLRSIDLAIVEQPPAYEHKFCGICGSPMPAPHDTTNTVSIPVGTLDDALELDVVRHIYVEYEVDWYPLAKTATRFSAKQIRDLRRRETQ